MARRRRRPAAADVPRPPSWAAPMVLAALVVSGAGLVGYGLFADGDGGVATPAPEATAPDGPLPTAPAPVTSGSGVFTNDAPLETVAAEAAASCPGCDVVLVTICSLRKDHVGVYGVHPDLTPRLDRVAEGGYRFDRAYAASNFTLASLSAVLTGRFGSATGMLGWNKGLPQGVTTLPQVLALYGYRTAGFTIDAPSGFRPDYGLDRGFQHMEIIPPPRDTPDGRFQPGPLGEGGETARPLARWLAEQPVDQPVFVMLHDRTAHFPFTIEAPGDDPTGTAEALWNAGAEQARKRPANAAMPGMAGGTAQQGVVPIVGPDPLQVHVDTVGEPAVKAWRDLYTGSVRWMDKDIGVVWEALEARGRLDRTIFVAVADHGESLNDHGELLHGDAYFDTVVNVPLLMRVPGLPGDAAPVQALVGHVDLMPTILDAVGAVPPAGIDGRSLLPLLRGEVDAVRGTTLSEGGVAMQTGDWASGAVFSPPWALLRQKRGCGPGADPGPPRQPGEPASCLFNMDDDPHQARNVAQQHPDVVKDLQERWDGYRAFNGNAGDEVELSPEFVEELRRTGYDFR